LLTMVRSRGVASADPRCGRCNSLKNDKFPQHATLGCGAHAAGRA